MDLFLDKLASLTPPTRHIICDKATEAPNTRDGHESITQGSYLCRRCGLALFRAHSQFHAGCGWPSFDDDLSDTVKQAPDADGRRMEILCSRCDGHLGHVFIGEQFTPKNRRYCVNSASIDFVHDDSVKDSEETIVAGGCFWGVDYYLKQIPGVLKVEVGYCGGMVVNPTYHDVCSGQTGHYEAARVLFDTSITDYQAVLKRFFEIHDPTQHSGQGPDLGPQYKSAVFYYNQTQKEQAEKLIQTLRKNGYEVATRLLVMQPFWRAETGHQDYYSKHEKVPYCHQPVSRFK